eukprot:5332970-Lingulodinium_polyedra.AAC.1
MSESSRELSEISLVRARGRALALAGALDSERIGSISPGDDRTPPWFWRGGSWYTIDPLYKAVTLESRT